MQADFVVKRLLEDDVLSGVYDAVEPFVTDEIREIEEAWSGGVADFGDAEAATAMSYAEGFDTYVMALRKALTVQLGFPFTAYRYMPREAYEDWAASGYSFFAGASLREEVARNWPKFAAHDQALDGVVVAIQVVRPDAVYMRGKQAESELVLDMGWIQPDETQILEYGGSSMAEHWSPKPEDGGASPSRRANFP